MKKKLDPYQDRKRGERCGNCQQYFRGECQEWDKKTITSEWCELYIPEGEEP